jgi:hypothetical protein
MRDITAASITLASAAERVVNTFLQNEEYKAFKASDAGLAEQAERDAKAAAQAAEYQATQHAAQARKDALLALGIESNGFTLDAAGIDALLALVSI